LLSFYLDCVKVSGWTVFKEVRIAEPEVLPIVLGRAEVQALLGAVREPRFRTALRLMYHCGLRVGEAVRIQVQDIRGRETPPRLHIRNGKGGKDRFVPIAPPMVEELRDWWRTHRNPKFLFPSPGRGWADRTFSLSQSMSRSTSPMSVSSVQMAYRLARATSAVNSASTTHSLRHSYATHLLEEGVSLRQISQYLGRESLDTTLIYTHLTAIPKLFVQIPRQVWSLDWVADVQPVGRGESALKYLAAYVYRTAFSAERILGDDGRSITFSYRHGRSAD